MFTLRCTQKLLRRGLQESAEAARAPSTLLGDWYANILVARPQHLVLCVSERTLLPVVLAAKDPASLPARLAEAAGVVLARVGVAQGAVERECTEMRAARVARTASRSVLGSMNDLMVNLEAGLRHEPGMSPLDRALWLAATPCRPLENATPGQATQALFAAAAVLARMGQRAL
jgi:hypothetical protein